MSTEENKAIVRRLTEEGFAGGSIAVVDEILAPDYAYHTASGGPSEGHDREWMKRVLRQPHDALPDVSITIEDMFAEGDRVVIRLIQRGTLRGDLPWGPNGAVMRATGKQVEFGGIVISRIAGGKVVEDWEVMEFPRLWSQLGAL